MNKHSKIMDHKSSNSVNAQDLHPESNSSSVAVDVAVPTAQPAGGTAVASQTPSGDRPLSARDRILYGLAILSICSANVALYIGLYMPPKGEIHSSLLYFFAMVCVFAATMFGISADFRSSLLSLRTEIHTSRPLKSASTSPSSSSAQS